MSLARQRSRRWPLLIGVAVLAAVILMARPVSGWLGLWSSNSSTEPLADEFADLRLGESFHLEFEDGTGSSDCLGGDCLRLDRYYISELPVAEACTKVHIALARWGEIHPDPEGEPEGVGDACAFSGTRKGYQVIAQVRADLAIESPNIIGQRTIDTPHNSVTFIELVDPNG